MAVVGGLSAQCPPLFETGLPLRANLAKMAGQAPARQPRGGLMGAFECRCRRCNAWRTVSEPSTLTEARTATRRGRVCGKQIFVAQSVLPRSFITWLSPGTPDCTVRRPRTVLCVSGGHTRPLPEAVSCSLAVHLVPDAILSLCVGYGLPGEAETRPVQLLVRGCPFGPAANFVCGRSCGGQAQDPRTSRWPLGGGQAAISSCAGQGPGKDPGNRLT